MYKTPSTYCTVHCTIWRDWNEKLCNSLWEHPSPWQWRQCQHQSPAWTRAGRQAEQTQSTPEGWPAEIKDNMHQSPAWTRVERQAEQTQYTLGGWPAKIKDSRRQSLSMDSCIEAEGQAKRILLLGLWPSPMCILFNFPSILQYARNKEDTVERKTWIVRKSTEQLINNCSR